MAVREHVMSLLDTLRLGVSIADSVTKPLQATVSFRHLVSVDGEGVKVYDPPIGSPATELLAIVDWKQKHLRNTAAELTVSRAMVMFLDPAALSTATGGDGVGDDDIIVLPDGTTGPILDMAGFIDAGTARPLATEVYLG